MTNHCKSGTCTRKPDNFGKGYCLNHAYQRGILQRHVPPHKAMTHIHFLMNEKGMSLNHITALVGISSGAMADIKNGRRKRIRASTEQKILAVTKASGFPQGFVKSWPYVRRIQALLAIGWSARDLADEFGMSLASLREHSHGENTTMKRATAALIKHKFERMSMRPATAPSVAVARQNWPRPFDWDDIDNPDETHPTTKITNPDMLPATPQVLEVLNYCVDELGGVKKCAEYFGVSTALIFQTRNRNRTQINKNLYWRMYRFRYHKMKKEKVAA